MKPFIRILIVLGCVLQGLFIKTEHEEKYLTADILKGAAALMFVLIGLSAEGNGPGDHLFVVGLIFGMIGDILLNLRYIFPKQGQKIFLGGIVAFLIGHLLYLAGLIPQASSPWLWPCALIGAILAAGLLAYIFKTMEVKKSFKIFGVFRSDLQYLLRSHEVLDAHRQSESVLRRSDPDRLFTVSLEQRRMRKHLFLWRAVLGRRVWLC